MADEKPTNIIKFPYERIKQAPDSDAVIERKQMQRYLQIDKECFDFFKVIEDDLLEHMIDPETFSKDAALIVEAIRSLILRQHDEEHFLHRLADDYALEEDELSGENDNTDELEISALPGANTVFDPA